MCMKKQSKFSKLLYNETYLGILLITPALVLIGFLILRPMIENFVLSFYKTGRYDPSVRDFVGLENYFRIFNDKTFWSSASNTVIWTVSTVASELLIGLAIALALNKRFTGRSIIRGLLISPWAVPVIAASFVWVWIYSDLYGVLNYFLIDLGVLGNRIVWLGNTQTALVAVIVANVWKGTPFMVMVLMAGLQQIPEEVIEAAKIDGANTWKQFRYITLPHLAGVIAISTLLRTIWNFNLFDSLWLLTQGGPLASSRTLSIHAYITSFQALRMGEGAAITTLMFVVLAILSTMWFRIRRRG